MRALIGARSCFWSLLGYKRGGEEVEREMENKILRNGGRRKERKLVGNGKEELEGEVKGDRRREAEEKVEGGRRRKTEGEVQGDGRKKNKEKGRVKVSVEGPLLQFLRAILRPMYRRAAGSRISREFPFDP